jgi:hypothetical protein
MQKDEAHIGEANECLRTRAGSSRTGENNMIRMIGLDAPLV